MLDYRMSRQALQYRCMRTYLTQKDKDATHTAAPERSFNQRMDALARANRIRVQREHLKRDLKRGRIPVRSLLLNPPEYIETAKVFDILLAVPKYGRVKANKILAKCRIPPSKTIGGLSERERRELLELLDPSARRGGSSFPQETRRTPGDRFRTEVQRLVTPGDLDAHAVERGARAAAADARWSGAIGHLLTRDDILATRDITPEALAELLDSRSIITLTARDGSTRFPEFQFSEGLPLGSLVTAHRIMVDDGHVSPWSAASWLMAPHPELDGLSPAQWAHTKRGDEHLLMTAKRDAAPLAN